MVIADLPTGQLVTVTLQLVVFGGQVWLALSQFLSKRKVDSTYQCDALYREITQLMIKDPDLLDFYDLGKGDWDVLSTQEKKLYLLSELNYFHFAFVYREYKAKRVDKGYWLLYENWMMQLLKSKNHPFMSVHEANKDLFESDFTRFIDAKINAEASR